MILRLGDLLGQATAIGRLREALASGRLPHALLFVGPPGVGKATAATALAARIFCERPTGESACGDCDDCALVAAGSHPDLHRIGLADDKRDVPIDDVRALRASLGRYPMRGSRRVAIVDDAHRLSEPGQNALLKTLEEPPGNALLVLVAARATALLPTVRSRCAMVGFRPLDVGSITAILRDQVGGDPAALAALAEAAEGSASLALASEGGDVRSFERKLDTLLERASAGATGVAEAARGLADEEKSNPRALRLLLRRLRSHLRSAAVELTDPDKTETLRSALRAAEAAHDGVVDVERNANRVLAFEAMMERLGRERTMQRPRRDERS